MVGKVCCHSRPPVLEQHAVSRSLLMSCASLVNLEITMCSYISIISALVEDAFVQRFEDTVRERGSSLDTNVIPLMQGVVNRALVRAFQSAIS